MKKYGKAEYSSKVELLWGIMLDALIWEREAASFLKDRGGESTWRTHPRQGKGEDIQFVYKVVELNLIVGTLVYQVYHNNKLNALEVLKTQNEGAKRLFLRLFPWLVVGCLPPPWVSHGLPSNWVLLSCLRRAPGMLDQSPSL